MRYYFINNDGEESRIDLKSAGRISHREIVANFEKGNVYVRRLAGKYFVSNDRVSWKKVAPLMLDKEMLINTNPYQVYRGYKPSGVGAGGEGELLTQMPGKIVKVLVKEGETVAQGQTLLILEAMKMENEIKSAVAGPVKAVYAKEGMAVEYGFLLLEIGE